MALLFRNRRSHSLSLLIGPNALNPAPRASPRGPSPIGCLCPFDSRHTRSPAASSATIQDVGYVCVPHVCAGEPGAPEAEERDAGCLRLTGVGGYHPDTFHGEAAGRCGQCDEWAGSGYPSGEAPAAEPGEGANPLRCARFSDREVQRNEQRYHGL